MDGCHRICHIPCDEIHRVALIHLSKGVTARIDTILTHGTWVKLKDSVIRNPANKILFSTLNTLAAHGKGLPTSSRSGLGISGVLSGDVISQSLRNCRPVREGRGKERNERQKSAEEIGVFVQLVMHKFRSCRWRGFGGQTPVAPWGLGSALVRPGRRVRSAWAARVGIGRRCHAAAVKYVLIYVFRPLTQ